ncbi:MAG: hypothetical protein WC028_24825 [Candidatus Obscuribacterales bacterium]
MSKTNWKCRLLAPFIVSLIACSHSTSMAFATEKTDADCWQIASDRFGRFGTMFPSQVEDLFGSSRVTKEKEPGPYKESEQVVRLDKDTILDLTATRTLLDEISLLPANQDSIQIHRRFAKDDREQDWESDAEYTYAPRSEENIYWATIRSRLRNFIGLDKDELRELLGPERCSSESLQTADYRIGCQRLRFYFTNKRVAFLQLVTDKYKPSSIFKTERLHGATNDELWPLFKEKIDQLLGAKTEDYKAMMNSYKLEKSSTSHENLPLPISVKLSRHASDCWFLDDRIFASVSMQSGLVSTIVFEPIHIAEDRKLPHGLARTGRGSTRPSDEDAVYTGAKRRDEATYWAAIKPNLRKLIGMNRQEIANLLGPERCYSDAGKSIDYRVGNSRLRFFLRKDVVIGFELTNDMYLHDT